MCLQETTDQCLVVFGRHRSSPPCRLAFFSEGSATSHDATRGGLAHGSEAYSTKCLEGKFCEVRGQGVLGTSAASFRELLQSRDTLPPRGPTRRGSKALLSLQEGEQQMI